MPEAKTRRAGRTTVAFGDVVRLSTERSSNPASDGFERFVGLEHLEPGNLRIRRWGDISDGTTFTSIFRPGQVLFGKRRAYQRKVAVADFRGVCSGDIYVLEPRGDDLLPELLPFICQTDAFFEHAVGTSAGSLSPRTNWMSLSGFQFNLPSIEEQRRLVLALQSAEHAHELLLRASDSASTVLDSWIETRMSDHAWPEHTAVNVLDKATVGIVVKPAALYVASGRGVPALRSLNVKPHAIVMDDCVAISQEGHSAHSKSRLLPGDVVVVRSGRPGDAAVVPDGCGEMNCIDLIIATPSRRLRPHFLCAVLNSAYGRRQFASGTAGTAQQHFNVEVFKKLRLPVPDLAVQDEFVLTMAAMRAANSTLERRRQDLQAMRALLLARSLAE